MGKRENNNKKQSIFKITSFQENNEVTGSCTLVEVDGLNILLDFGGVQNDRIDFYRFFYTKSMNYILYKFIDDN